MPTSLVQDRPQTAERAPVRRTRRGKPTPEPSRARATQLELELPLSHLAFAPSDISLAVMAFHRAFGLPRRAWPSADVDPSLVELRVRLLAEEVGEFAEASRAGDIVGLADALGDIVYVAYGAAVTYGIDLDAVLAEVHRANMSKLDEWGRPVLRADGKVMKSARYRPPDVARVIAHQLPLVGV